MRLYRYSPWVERQELSSLDADDIMGMLADMFIEKGDFSWALNTLIKKGASSNGERRLSGLHDLIRQIQDSRREPLETSSKEELLDESRREVMKALEKAGYAIREGDRERLTARGVRKIGEKALRDIFALLGKDQFGNHDASKQGIGSIRSEETRKYQFGDPFSVDLGRTLMNALNRAGYGPPLIIQPQDFEIYQTEFLTRSSTILMLDMSWSMAWNNRFFAAKKVAIALNNLIQAQFPIDSLHIVGFHAEARALSVDELPYLYLHQGYSGTNMQEGLRVSERILSKEKGSNKQVIMISDGQPTAHREPNGRLFFKYPSSQETLSETLKAVKRCTQSGITINVFMLSDDHAMKEFVNKIVQINKGRAFYTTPETLGQYLLIDYLTKKRKRVAS
ncbi:MAG: hypothetical protein HY731_06315 [Candidatus Tectomicrobia bacterium]|nr:hypothetical protein [Candidatus Tectomicrobia bacterium]